VAGEGQSWEITWMESHDEILCEHYGRMLELIEDSKVAGVDVSLL
jgi:hypothetical protein